MTSKASDRDVARLLKEFKAAGWRVERGARHFHCYAPHGGAIVIVPTTPSDPRALLNCRSLLRREQNKEKGDAPKSE
jgi:hypothetical protein